MSSKAPSKSVSIQKSEAQQNLRAVDCSWNWSNWSNCDTFTGEQTRTVNVITNPMNGGKSCPRNKETQPCPVNCQGKWSDWSCNAICPGNTIKYKLKGISNGTFIDRDLINSEDFSKVGSPITWLIGSIEETDISNNNVFSTISKITPNFEEIWVGNNSKKNRLKSYSTTQAKTFRTFKVEIPPLNNGSACPFSNGEIQTSNTDCSNNCYDCKYSFTETSACNAACPGWNNQNNIVKSGNANYMNPISDLDTSGNPATRTGIYKIIKQGSNGGKECLSKDGDIVKENCSKPCNFDCSGSWMNVSQCNATCPGNAGDANQGFSSVKTFLAPGSSEQTIVPATINKKFTINRQKLPGGKACEAANQATQADPCSKACKLNCQYNWVTEPNCSCYPSDESYQDKQTKKWVRDGYKTKTTTFINKSYNDETCNRVEYRSGEDDGYTWITDNITEEYIDCTCPVNN